MIKHRHPLLVTVAMLALAMAGSAQSTFTESFDGGSNAGAWSWGTGNETISPLNGHPGPFLQDLTLASFNPAASTAFGATSAFTGDYRTGQVTSVGIDIVILNSDFGVSNRKLTVMLLNDNDTPGFFDDDWGAYFIGDVDIPDPGVPAITPAGWTAYDFAIPSQESTTPAGWTWFAQGGHTWPQLMRDVNVLQFHYGDPALLYLINSWDVGMDNTRITRETWQDLGHGLAGTHGVPALVGTGVLFAGTDISIELSGALENTTAFLVVGFAELNFSPFYGGTLVPDINPPGFFIPLPTDGTGAVTINETWPGTPTGLRLILQYWIEDGGAPFGKSASNAVAAVSP